MYMYKVHYSPVDDTKGIHLYTIPTLFGVIMSLYNYHNFLLVILSIKRYLYETLLIFCNIIFIKKYCEHVIINCVCIYYIHKVCNCVMYVLFLAIYD